MTRQEFESRTGIEITEQEFSKVHDIYMESGQNMDKDQFCEDWKEHSDSKLLHIFFNQADRLKDKLDQKCIEIYNLAVFILEQAEVCGSPALREKAIIMLGIEKYLRIKIEKGYNLWDADKKDLIEILKTATL